MMRSGDSHSSEREIIVRTPKNGRSRSITVLSLHEKPRDFLVRLNQFNKVMKKHKQPSSNLSNIGSPLDSIIEDSIAELDDINVDYDDDQLQSQINSQAENHNYTNQSSYLSQPVISSSD